MGGWPHCLFVLFVAPALVWLWSPLGVGATVWLHELAWPKFLEGVLLWA